MAWTFLYKSAVPEELSFADPQCIGAAVWHSAFSLMWLHVPVSDDLKNEVADMVKGQ